MSDDTIQIEINGVPVPARKGQMIIEVTDQTDAYVPRFCYHPKLSIAANCRMCLVEVENVPKPLPACATPVADGMKVRTRSKLALAAQRATMEFLLINHPLDCPICDQGGECELQDLAMGFGRDVSRYTERKRVVKDKDLGPLVSTDMTRCIHCTRCVRFGQEVAGIQELGTIGRGESTEIGTFIEQSVDHELSGNIIDLCPVGALNNKPYRYRARSWEMTQHASVSGHDCAGSNLYVHGVRGRIMRAVPRANEAVNETWLSDRDRFACHGLYGEDRLTTPMIRRDGTWHAVEWETALSVAAEGLQAAAGDGGGNLGFLAHPSSTLEELTLLTDLAAGLGSANVDHRIRRADFGGQASDLAIPGIGMEIAEIETLSSLLVVGGLIRQEVPILAHRVRKAALAGCRVSFVNSGPGEWLFPVGHEMTGDPAANLAAVLSAAAGQGSALPPSVAERVRAAEVTAAHRDVAAGLGPDSAVWLGLDAVASTDFGDLQVLARALATATGARFGVFSPGANSAGAALAGAQPHRGRGAVRREREGLDIRAMLAEDLQARVLLGLEPEDLADGVVESLERTPLVVALTPFAGESLKRCADVLLPVGTYLETSGTFVNCEGRWQSFAGAARPPGEARPAWKVLRVLGNLLQLDGFDAESSEQVRDRLAQQLEGLAPADPEPDGPTEGKVPAADGPVAAGLYEIDQLVRRSEPLQQTRAARASTDAPA